MKTMTCKQLGGACDKTFTANTFEEMGELSKIHGIEMFKTGDKDHLAAMADMSELMEDPNAMQNWFANKQKEFESLVED